MRQIVLCLAAVLMLAGCGMTLPQGDGGNGAFGDSDRTHNRTITGTILYPKWLLARPEHYEFSPLVSNHDPVNSHPAQWDGQDWDPAAWNEDWTPEVAVQKFVEARIFSKQYLDRGVPVLELGPTFYKLSDLDRRRALKLVADYTGVFGMGHETVILRDWDSKKTVGSYSEKGMFLH